MHALMKCCRRAGDARRGGRSGGRIYDVKDVSEDPHYRARKMIVSVASAAGLTVETPGLLPKWSLTPGAISRRPPTLGEDTDSVLRDVGVTVEQLAALRMRGVI